MMKHNNVMISVCVATYNGETYIERQLTSILHQIKQDDEVIISDDCSTDKTLEIINGLNDSRIKLLQNNGEGYRNLISNFENSLIHATGDIIFLSDQDDIWMDNKVSTMLNMLELYDLVVSNCVVVDENLHVICDSFFSFRHSGNGLLKNILKNTYMGCCMAFNRKIYDLILPFPKNIGMHDWWIGIIAEIYGQVKFIDDKLLLYRRHSSNASMFGQVSRKKLLEKIKIRITFLKSLLFFMVTKTVSRK